MGCQIKKNIAHVRSALRCGCPLVLVVYLKIKKNKALREPRGELSGPLCACACSLYINKKNKCCKIATAFR